MDAVTGERELLSVEEVAGYLGVGTVTVYRWCREGRLPCLKVGRSWRIRRGALDDFLSRGERPATLVGQLRGFLAVPDAVIAVDALAGTVRAEFSDGSLALTWRRLPDRRIALLTIPRLHVRFAYSGLTPARRYEVQRRFDLATQRGGGACQHLSRMRLIVCGPEPTRTKSGR